MEKLNNLTMIEEQEDLDNLKKFISYKNNLMNSIGIENFINKVREIIDNSEVFEFRNERSRKFINRERPIFILKIKNEYNNKFVGDKNISDLKVADEITNEVTSYLKKEIINNISTYVSDCIENNENLKKYFESFDETLKDLCVSNIYGIRNSIEDNIIYLEYFR